jgi:hypothetical protein
MDDYREVFAALKRRGHALLTTSNWSFSNVFKWVKVRVFSNSYAKNKTHTAELDISHSDVRGVLYC